MYNMEETLIVDNRYIHDELEIRRIISQLTLEFNCNL